jgi:ubiquinone/menaquinone biosynthesis C-methylase UbiE
MPRRVVARDYRTAYDHRARYYRDPVMMTGRDAALTRFKIDNVVARLPLHRDASVADVGPGDGSLFRAIHERVGHCVGIDPSEHAVARLRTLFSDVDDVQFVVGTCTELPPPAERFDVVVINSVIHMLADEEEVRRTLRSLHDVCRPGGTVYVGEVPFRQERASGLLAELAVQVRHVGLGRALRAVFEMYLRPLARGEPLLIEPMGRTLAFSTDAFTGLARAEGFEVECLPHLEPRGPSSTRVDYVLSRRAG